MFKIVEFRQFSSTDAAWCVSTYPTYARGQEGRCTAIEIVRYSDESTARVALVAAV